MEKIIQGDCLIKLKDLESNSVDTIITDPPYGLSFMGKKWDYDVPSIEIWKECLRVLKPGGTALIFAGSRTQHRMAVNVEDAGFILKDTIMWLYGSGFPKATDISKQLKKDDKNINEAQLWNGWKSHGLKPAYEPILVCMKPNDGTYASNALKWGVSGLNIDGGRIGSGEDKIKGGCGKSEEGWNKIVNKNKEQVTKDIYSKGRFPANIILDEEAGRMLDEQSGVSKSSNNNFNAKDYKEKNTSTPFTRGNFQGRGDKGGASRFFYCAKASKSERNAGCEALETKTATQITGRKEGSKGLSGSKEYGNSTNPYANGGSVKPRSNHHPTVKPLKLMEYLCIITKTPTGGIVLDPFAGSGTTGIACINTGRKYILIEREKEYIEIIKARISSVKETQTVL